jgi:cell division septation protein DedD
MSNQTGSSRTDTIVKVMLVFFISLLSFSVGTFVGKQVSDSDHRRMALESEAKDTREVASTEEGSGKVSEKDVENLAEEFVNKDKAGEKVADGEKGEAKEEKAGGKEGADGYKDYSHGKKDEAKAEKTEKVEAPAEKTAEKTEKTEKHAKMGANEKKMEEAAAEKPMQEKAEAKKQDPRKPASALPGVVSSNIGKFTVQVASYATEDEAKSHASQLKTKGWNAFYIPATIAGKTWFRVSVGLFNNAMQAKSFRTDFVKESNTKTAIVQKIVQ